MSPRLDRAALRRHRLRNLAQAGLLLGGIAALLALSAWALAGAFGLAVVAAAIAVLLAVRPNVSGDWVLRAYGARPLPFRAAPDLHRLLAALAERAGLPATPRLHYVPSRALNAFAVGRRDDAAVGVTDGLLRTMRGRELAAILAHEVSHVRADDLWVMGLADTIGRMTHALAYAGLALLVVGAPLAAGGQWTPLLVALALTIVPTAVTLLQLALSRAREHDADLQAAQLTGDPVGLASALRRLERHEGRIWERVLVPHRRGGPDPLLLRTHPPTEERVARLLELVPQAPADLPGADRRHLPAGYPRVAGPTRLRFPGVWR